MKTSKKKKKKSIKARKYETLIQKYKKESYIESDEFEFEEIGSIGLLRKNDEFKIVVFIN